MRWAYAAAVALITVILALDVWFDIDYRLAANVSLVIVAVFVNVFTVLYWARSRWWANRIGKIYLAKSIVLSLFLTQIVVASWWDTDYPGRQHIRFAIYTLGAVVYLPMICSLWREQTRDRANRPRHGAHTGGHTDG